MLESQPFAFGNLTVRSLLDMREHCLIEFDFHDVYLKQKQIENKAAMALLPGYLEKLRSMEETERQEALALGLLAGNVFDWGAKEVALLMEAGQMDFEAAKSHIGPRPWLIDDVDSWISRMKGDPHKCCCIFIDNSGGDFILGQQTYIKQKKLRQKKLIIIFSGVVPFVEEMLSRGTRVILCANTRPILNDVTYAELSLLLGQVSKVSPLICSALDTGMLVARDSGQGSPCLDLARMNQEVRKEYSKYMKIHEAEVLICFYPLNIIHFTTWCSADPL